MSESKFESALFAARVHVKSGTFLSDGAVRDVCEELLRLAAERKVPDVLPCPACFLETCAIVGWNPLEHCPKHGAEEPEGGIPRGPTLNESLKSNP